MEPLQQIQLNGETFLDVIQKISSLAGKPYVIVELFCVSAENNFQQIFEETNDIYQVFDQLKKKGDQLCENKTYQYFINKTFELKIEQNGEKNSLKFFAQQDPDLRNFLPFGSCVSVVDDQSNIIVSYTRKQSPLTEVFHFRVATQSEFLSILQSMRRK